MFNFKNIKGTSLLFALAFLFVGLNAQQDIYLRINHKLGSNAFQMNTATTNNIGDEFSTRRLQYYISEITLVHDGGTETMVPNTWILADASQPIDMLLGNFNVTNLESIHFGIGVEQAFNHLDPASYAMNHPLAPKSPSMHWGWSSGYRFIAMEGNSGSNLSQTFEIHTVDDGNYFVPTVTTSGEAIANGLRIDLNADYEMALKDINVAAGPITHGSNGVARTIAQNFRDFVFSPAGNATALDPSGEVLGFGLYPNPSTGAFNVVFDAQPSAELEVIVYDFTGRIMQKATSQIAGNLQLEIETAGCYLVAIQQEGKVLATQRLVIQ